MAGPNRAPVHDARTRADEAWLNSRRGAGLVPFVLSLAAAVAGALLLIAQCWLLARVLAAAVVDGAGLDALTRWLWPLLAVLALRVIFDILRQGLAFEAATRVKRALRAALTGRIAGRGPVWMERQRSGAIAATLGEGVEAVEAYFASYLPQKLIAGFVPLAILVAVFPNDWVSGLILGITAPIVPLFMIVIGKGAEALSQKQWHKLTAMGAHFFDAIEGLTTLRQFGASRREVQTIARISEEYRSATMSVLLVAFLSSLVLEFFATISVAMVAVYVGFRLYYGELTFLPGLFALLLAPEFYRPLRDMGTHYHARMDAIGAAESLQEILAGEKAPGAGTSSPAAVLAPGAPKEIVFEGVSFAHESGRGVEDISFRLAGGETLALLGPSGAGKTTVAKLALGFLTPDAGRILADGQDLRGLDAEEWQRHLGWMPQRATLFAGTIAENIRLARPAASEAEMREAARIAQADAFIRALPDGYETRLGDGGQGLSGGQIQRVAIARLLLPRPALMILDEPSAALDRKTGRAMLAALRAARPEAAILTITHDIALAGAADRVLMLDHGKIVEQGAPGALARAGGAYAELRALTLLPGGTDAPEEGGTDA